MREPFRERNRGIIQVPLQTPDPRGQTVRYGSSMPTVTELRGLWRRSMIAWPDGKSDGTTTVRWLQGLRAYVDLRQPAELARGSSAAGLAELSIEDCRQLARQEGFAGHLSFDGAHFLWQRTIDFQPESALVDTGSLKWENEVLIEIGRDIGYVEHWHRDAAAASQPAAALCLHDGDRAMRAVFLRVGAAFMWARDRTAPLPAHRTLSDCLATASTTREAQALVDCEISFGCVSPQGFRITASTLPYRVGDLLHQRFADHALGTMDRSPDASAIARLWEIIDSEGEISALAACDAG